MRLRYTNGPCRVALRSNWGRTTVDAPLFRITVDPTSGNGLMKICQIQVDKIMTIRQERIGEVIGQLDEDALIGINRALAVWIGIA
ncbi:MAG: hypothetical protein B7Y41_11815 [Hydrogenophilales bacterium 28-61-23]|nr:MAG: hypothetical protein B7Y41_11815 [Hydrogenophilales bacterium 28-61-23]